MLFRSNFTESSKVRKAATFLKGNALQWWTNLLLQGQAPTIWVEFKQVFSATWLTTTFEVDIMMAWHKLDAANCANLEEYNNKFWKALLPIDMCRYQNRLRSIVADCPRRYVIIVQKPELPT